MGVVFYRKHFHFGLHRRFWLIATALLAFLLAALWTRPIG